MGDDISKEARAEMVRDSARKALAEGAPIRRDEPIRAFKAAYLAMTGEGVQFRALATSRTYGPQSVSACHCRSESMLYGNLFANMTLTPAGTITYSEPPPPREADHPVPTRDSRCGFYAWKPETPFPWTAGTWLLETDLYGTVIEHEGGYRAQKQRVLSISPVVGLACDAQLSLFLAGETIQAACAGCHIPKKAHPVPVDRLRSLLGVEISLDRAWSMREKGLGRCP